MNSSRGIVMCVCLLAVLVSAQITFSRDWVGGKRSGSHGSHMGPDCSQFTRLCRHFVDELKQAFTSEIEKHREESEKSLLYDDE